MASDPTYEKGVVQLRDDGNLHIPTGKWIDLESGGKVTSGDVPMTWRAIKKVITKADFTDGGSTSGTYALAVQIPVGAIFYRAKVTVEGAFSGDTSAVVTIGDGSDVDRYNTGTPSVFAAAANGVDVGPPSGVHFHATAATVTVTVTSATDFTAISALAQLTLTLYLLDTI